MAEKTLRKELVPFDNLENHYPKYLLTMDYVPYVSYNGIRQLTVFDWLLDK